MKLITLRPDHEVGVIVGGPRKALPTSKKSKCDTCGSEVWLAPSSLKLIERQNPEIACLQCVIDAGGFPEQAAVASAEEYLRDLGAGGLN